MIGDKCFLSCQGEAKSTKDAGQSRCSTGNRASKIGGAAACSEQTKEMRSVVKLELLDSPDGLLAIGTFGRSDFRGSSENHNRQEKSFSSEDLLDFTPEEVGKLQIELTKLLSLKSSSETDKHVMDLLLYIFVSCPSSLEVDLRISSSLHSDLDDYDVEEIDIERTISVILRRCEEMCANSNKKASG
ncbi:hypothetical protein NL676_025950 [Syzygium grande]|nr:hypothetical protein NL676_025950 [Syzygium grande]